MHDIATATELFIHVLIWLLLPAGTSGGRKGF